MANKKKHRVNNELKIRFRSQEGIDMLSQYKSVITKSGEYGSINRQAEEDMISAMRTFLSGIPEISGMVFSKIDENFNKMSNIITKSIKMQVSQLSYEIKSNTIPLDMKINLLTNLLADKDVIDSINAEMPDTKFLQDPLVITKLKNKLKSEFLNKQSKN